MAKNYEELASMILEYGAGQESENIIEEGANTALKGIKQDVKALKKINIKGMKQMYKSGNFAGAKAEGEKILAAIEDCEKQFKAVDQSFGNAALGDLKGTALRLIKDIGLGIITLGIGTIIQNVKRIMSRCIQIQKASGSKDIDYKQFNSYANDILMMLDDMKHQVKAVIAKCDEGLKATGSTTTQESVDTDLDDKLAIYESARAGEISEEDRDELLKLFDESSETIE